MIVPIGPNDAVGDPNVIALDGFQALPGFDPHPCATWAPDGRWVAVVGSGDVWVVDADTGAIRRLPDLRPTDLEWRPGTDELTIAGDIGRDRSAETSSTPVTVYSVSDNELRPLGSIRAASLTWSPDGSTLAYPGWGERPCGGGRSSTGVLAVGADPWRTVTVLTDDSSLTGFVYYHPWAPVQMWGRLPG